MGLAKAIARPLRQPAHREIYSPKHPPGGDPGRIKQWERPAGHFGRRSDHMARLPLVALAVVHLLQTATLGAQSSDPLAPYRRCDKRLTALRMALLTELGDFARLDGFLSRSADPRGEYKGGEVPQIGG